MNESPSNVMRDSMNHIAIDIIKHHDREPSSLENKIVDSVINNNKNEWRSCCFRMNKDFVQFTSHLGILLILLIITSCGVFLDNNHSTIWINLLCLVIGAILPSPSYHENHEKKNNDV
jgi:hypothetical protein